VAPGSRLTLPNIITLVRIAVCPVVYFLALGQGSAARYGAFVLFIAAALSDIWDGYLARKHGLITDMGKLLDPLADKLLLVVTFVPFYMISHRSGEANRIPYWGDMPMWVLVVIFGRELFITLFRQWAQRRGVVIAAGKSGKFKAAFQNIFIGALLLWYPLLESATRNGWRTAGWWRAVDASLGGLIGVSLAIAIALTVYSMIDDLWSYRSLVGARG
jgi:CDP-diacylglycerol---glycerol-3-phosphate 3-phosphatidyltransferase